MKVLIQDSPSLPYGMVSGITSVLEVVGHTVEVWADGGKPAFDVFDELEPDLFLCGKGAFDRPVEKCLSERVGRVLTASLVTMSPAADTFAYYHTQPCPKHSSQIACVGDVNQNIFDSLIVPLLDLDVKIVGQKHWPVPQYLGTARPDTLRTIYSSALVTLCLNTTQPPHNILAAGGMPVVFGSSKPPFDGVSLCYAHTFIGYEEVVRKIIIRTMDRTRKRYINEGRELVYRGETYWHRVAELFESVWGMGHEAERVMKIYNATSRL